MRNVSSAVKNACLLVTGGLIFSVSGHAADKLLIDGSTGVAPLIAALAKAYEAQNPGISVEIGKGLGTKERIQALADGKIDLAMASHGLNVADIERQGMLVHHIGKTAVVFGVNASVPVTNLNEIQLCDIYSGKIQNWKEVGGLDVPIVALTRPDSEVDAQVVREKITCLASLKMAEAVKVMQKAGEMAQGLSVTSHAIGMTTMTVVEQSQNQVKPLAIGGVMATAENVQKRSYMLARDSFLVVKTPPSPTAARFLNFVRSPAGAELISANGAIPMK